MRNHHVLINTCSNFFILLLLLLLPVHGASTRTFLSFRNLTPHSINHFMLGADVSSLQQLEDNHVTYYNEFNQQQSLLPILHEYGISSVRYRLLVNPQFNYTTITRLLEFIPRLQALNMSLFLDIFYSDSWTDPAHQSIPKQWANASFEDVTSLVYNYTFNVLTQLKNKGMLPSLIQIGNEINCGFLWPFGNICHPLDSSDKAWRRFTKLLRSSIAAIHAVDIEHRTRVVIHLASIDYEHVKWFLTALEDYNVQFDVIGFSYYPWWHGSLSRFIDTVTHIEQSFTYQLVLAEYSYPWTLKWNDSMHNLVGWENQTLPQYPASITGQANYIHDLLSVLKQSSLVIGAYYWEPEWVSLQTLGSSVENLALFDFSHKMLVPSFRVLQDLVKNPTHQSITSQTVTLNEEHYLSLSFKVFFIILIVIAQKKHPNILEISVFTE